MLDINIAVTGEAVFIDYGYARVRAMIVGDYIVADIETPSGARVTGTFAAQQEIKNGSIGDNSAG